MALLGSKMASLGLKLASLGALFGPKPAELGRDWLLEPTSQARYANIAGTSYLIASQSLFSLSGLMVLFSCLSAKGLGGDREALTIRLLHGGIPSEIEDAT